MFGLMLWSCLWVVLLCVWFSQKKEKKFRKNIVMGVTLPFEAHEDPDVLDLLNKFKQHNNLACALLAVLCIAGVFLQDMTISLICWSVVFILVLSVPMTIFAKTNRKLKALKQERGWSNPSRQQIQVNVSAIISYPKPKPATYLLPAFACIIPLLAQRSLWWAHGLTLGTVILSYCTSIFLYRKKSETIDNNADLAQTLSALRYRMWKRIWLASAYCAAITSLYLGVRDFNSGRNCPAYSQRSGIRCDCNGYGDAHL